MCINNSEDSDAQVLIDTLETFSLKQYIPFPNSQPRTYTRPNSNRKQYLPSH